VPIANGEFIASQIPDAKFVAVPGEDHLLFGDTEAVYGEIEEFLTGARTVMPTDRELATLVFTDIVGSTSRAAELGDAAWRIVLDQHDAAARQAAVEFRGRIVKTTGDGVLATFDGPARAVDFAGALGHRLRTHGVVVRAGVHTGEIELRGEDIGGIAVHIASRIASLAGPGEVLASRTVKDITAGSRLTFQDRGVRELKGIRDPWQLYSVVSRFH
jgi:class 3 adenylate cyclase